jgi:putative ABC transport system substrate-binding protein
MRRRDLLAILATAALPRAAHAQAVPLIGFVDSGAPGQFPDRLAGFRRGLAEIGFEEGRNLAVEYRWAEGKYDRLPALAAELAARPIAVLVATGAVNVTQAALAAAKTIPVVFANGGDPLKLGLVDSLSRPGGNATGVSFFIGTLGPKRVALLRELAPDAKQVGIIANPANPVTADEVREMQAAAQGLGMQASVLNVSTDADIEAAFAAVARERLTGLLVNTDSFLSSRRRSIVDLATKARLPTVYAHREFSAAGGLLSYGTDLADGYRQAGIYAGRVLRGVKPADLPVLLPTKFELVVNLKAAAALGIELPTRILSQADEVIE